MEIVDGHAALAHSLGRRLRAPALAIGNFDGVHVGHQRLFEEARRRAAPRGGESVALTFEPHPARVLAARLAPPLITTLARKLELIAEARIDVTVVEPFTLALAAWSPEDFVTRILVDALGAKDVCVGWDFTFGKERAGTTERLSALGAQHGFAVSILDPVSAGGITCSSTKIRELLLEGNVEGAAILLGRPHEIAGEVVTGAGRGRTIGVPTANLRTEGELLPATGVYSAIATRLADGSTWRAAVNIGNNPTFGGQPLSVEAHLIGYDGPSLVGERVRLGLGRRLRAEQRFVSVSELVAQIRRDIEEARVAP